MDEAPFLTLPPGGAAPAATWWLKTSDGLRLRAARWRADTPMALAVLLSGRTEFLEKMAVPAAELLARGYDVVSLDWRGQGLSNRLLESAGKGHVASFADYQLDLDALLASAPVAESTASRLMLAHSMGGAIATAGMLRSEVAHRFQALVLSAPMFGIALSAPMRAAAWLTMRVGRLLGKAEKWPPFGDPATPYVLTNPRENVLTHDREIWDWLVATARDHPALNLGMPTLGWFDQANHEMARLGRAAPLSTPGLCLLGGGEKVVDGDAVRQTCQRLGVEVCEIPGARHEHLVEAPEYRAQAWAAIDRFLADEGLPAKAPA